MMKLLTRREERKHSIWDNVRELVFLGVSAGSLFVILREIRQTQALIENNLEKQRQAEKRLQQTCDRVLEIVVQLEEKAKSLPSGDSPLSITEAEGTARTRRRSQGAVSSSDGAAKKPARPRKAATPATKAGEASKSKPGEGVEE